MNRNGVGQGSMKRSPRRRFRLWEKKRGPRQTGSSWWGSAGEAAFYAALFLIGVFALTEITTLWWVAPDESFLSSNWALGIGVAVCGTLILSSAVFAVSTTILTATSAERRAAIAQRASSRDLLEDLRSSAGAYPTIPSDTHWKISPGVRLAYRLPSSSTTGFRLTFLAVFTLLWNAAVIVLAVLEFNLVGRKAGEALREFLSKPWINLTGVIITVFAGCGAYLLYRLIRQLTAAEAMGPTHVEVSAQPFEPGGEYRVMVTQHGHLDIRVLELSLVCVEEVSFSEGTDTRTEARRVFEEPVGKVEGIEIRPSEPFHHEITVRIPDDAMHSFVANHNSITWKILVTVTSKRWPEIRRVFPLIMHPGASLSTESSTEAV